MAMFGFVWTAERKDEHLHWPFILSWLTWLTSTHACSGRIHPEHCQSVGSTFFDKESYRFLKRRIEWFDIRRKELLVSA